MMVSFGEVFTSSGSAALRLLDRGADTTTLFNTADTMVNTLDTGLTVCPDCQGSLAQ